jgi:hypothetical protein
MTRWSCTARLALRVNSTTENRTRCVKFVLFAVISLCAAASAIAARAPGGAVANCSTQSGASFPGAFSNPRNLVLGPLTMIGARGVPEFTPGFHGQKFPLLVRSGHRVTLELTRRTRRFAALGYGPLPQGDVGVRDGHRVVRFIACGRRHGSASNVDGLPVTFWSGGVLATSPRCVPIRVWIDGARSPRQIVIRLGVARCG